MSDIGVNFRQTAGYVTDGANETYDLGAAYPVTRGGATFGWVGTVGGVRDRNNTADRRLAGVIFVNHLAGAYWRIDQPAGNYDVHAALGDYSFQYRLGWDLKDGAGAAFASWNQSTLQTVQTWFDASGVQRTLEAWPGSNAVLSVTLTSDHFRFLENGGGGSSNVVVAHLRFVSSGGGGTFTASASLTSGSTTLSASASHTPPSFTASAALTSGATTLAASATHTPPSFTASAALTTGAATLEASASFATQVFDAIASLSSGSTVLAATVTDGTLPTPTRRFSIFGTETRPHSIYGTETRPHAIYGA